MFLKIAANLKEAQRPELPQSSKLPPKFPVVSKFLNCQNYLAFKNSLALRLTLWYAASFFTLVLIILTLTYATLREHLSKEHNQVVLRKATGIVSLLKHHDPMSPEVLEELGKNLPSDQFYPLFVRVMSKNGKPLAETSGMSRLLPVDVFPSAKNRRLDSPVFGQVRSKLGLPFHSLVFEEEPYIFQLALDDTSEEAILTIQRRTVFFILFCGSIVSVLVGYWIAHNGYVPLKKISEKAGRVGVKNLGERINMTGLPIEIQELVVVFNKMLDRLEASFETLSQFSVDVAHELRTPLNNLGGIIGVALLRQRTVAYYEEILGIGMEDCDRIKRIVDSLLFLARAETSTEHGEAQLQRERFEVNDEIKKIIEFYEGLASEEQVTLRAELNASVVSFVNLDRILFQSAVGNLLANALRHVPKGGEITARVFVESSLLFVEVIDNGCGIPPIHLSHVFDRFYRTESARTNNNPGELHLGLGLPIVKRIAELHGGSAKIASEVAKGTRVTLSFSKWI